MNLVFQNSWKWIQDNIYISNIVNAWQTKFAVAIFWFKLLYLFLSIWSCSVFNISWYHVPYFWTKQSCGAQTTLTCTSQKQPSRGVLKKRCSENIQHIYSKTRCFATLLKGHFCMGVLLQICCIFSEQFFLRTPLDNCFWSFDHIDFCWLNF